MKSENSEKIIPKWLKRLQENSWEMEILISGGAIFSLFQLSDFYIDWVQQIRMTNHLPGSALLMILGMFGIKVLTLGFSLHLISRGFWLSLVCLNDVFPKGILENKIKWKKPFQTKLANSKLQDQIISVDKTCGSIMYLSIVAAFAIIGLVLLVILLSASIYLAESILYEGIWLIDFFVISFLVYLLDLLIFGVFRKIPFLSYLIYPIFKIYDFLSLRNYYQKSLWTFNTNINKFKFSGLALVFLCGALILMFNSLYRVMHWPNILDDREYRFHLADDHQVNDLHYMDAWDYSRSFPYGISSKIIKGDFAEVYLRYDKDFDVMIDETHENREQRTYAAIVDLILDGERIEGVEWLPARKPNGDYGISCMLNVKNLSEGRHTITFTSKKVFEEVFDAHVNRPKAINIPFWIDHPDVQVSTPVNQIKQDG